MVCSAKKLCYVEDTAVDAEKRLMQILTELGNVAPTILNERQQRIISGSIAKGYGYLEKAAD